MEHISLLGNNSFRACCWAVGGRYYPMVQRHHGAAQARGCNARLAPTLTSGYPPGQEASIGTRPPAHPMFHFDRLPPDFC